MWRTHGFHKAAKALKKFDEKVRSYYVDYHQSEDGEIMFRGGFRLEEGFWMKFVVLKWTRGEDVFGRGS